MFYLVHVFTGQDESVLIWYSGKDEKQLKLSQVSKIIPGQRTVSACIFRYLSYKKKNMLLPYVNLSSILCTYSGIISLLAQRSLHLLSCSISSSSVTF